MRNLIEDWYDRIVIGDALNALDGLPYNSVDLIFIDPPYKLELPQDRELKRPDGSLVEGVGKAKWDIFESDAAYRGWTAEYLAKCRDVLKYDGSLFIMGMYQGFHPVAAIMQDQGWWFRNEIAWIKNNPTPQFRGVRLCQAHETILWATRSKHSSPHFDYHWLKEINGGKQMRTDWYFPICQGSQRVKGRDGKSLHETQKPEALLYRIIKGWTRPGDVVLDFFAGVGTTWAVAKGLERHCVNVEIDPVFSKAAIDRVAGVEWGKPTEWALINNL